MPTTQVVPSPARQPQNDTPTEPPLRVLVRYKKTDTFDDQLRFVNSFVKVTIILDAGWKVSPDPIVVNRLVRDLEAKLGADKGQDDTGESLNEAEVTLGGRHNSDIKDRIDVFSDQLSLQQVSWAVGDAVRRLSRGDGYKLPTVSTNDHKQMVEYGIKLRKDGLFGYHLLCNRDGCPNETNTCYTKTDLHDAIIDKQNRRSMWSCCTYCWLKQYDPLEIDPDLFYHENDFAKALQPYVEYEDEQDGDETIRTAIAIDLDRLKDEDPDLLKRLGDHLSELCEPVGEDAGSAACET